MTIESGIIIEDVGIIMQYCSMLPDDTIISFRSELDRMELDNRDVGTNREYITRRIEQLAGAAYND